MKIKLLGVDLQPSNGISLSDLFNYMASAGDEQVEVGAYNRFLYTGELGDYFVGLIITTKDHNKYLEFKRDKTAAKLEARDVSDGAKLADFNFFAVHKETGRGIYQYYHHSCSVNTFGMLCRVHYEKLKGKRLEAARDALGEVSQSAEKRIRQQFRGSLKWELVVRQEAFDKLVAELKSVKAITLAVSTIAYKGTAFSPLATTARYMTQRFSFQKGASVMSVAAQLRDLIGKTDINGAKVEGTDADGLEQIIKLANTPDQFGEFDFDRIAELMTIVPSEFVKSSFLAEMIKIAGNTLALRPPAK